MNTIVRIILYLHISDKDYIKCFFKESDGVHEETRWEQYTITQLIARLLTRYLRLPQKVYTWLHCLGYFDTAINSFMQIYDAVEANPDALMYTKTSLIIDKARERIMEHINNSHLFDWVAVQLEDDDSRYYLTGLHDRDKGPKFNVLYHAIPFIEALWLAENSKYMTEDGIPRSYILVTKDKPFNCCGKVDHPCGPTETEERE